MVNITPWLVVWIPLKNMKVKGWWFIHDYPIYIVQNIQHVWNHQPAPIHQWWFYGWFLLYRGTERPSPGNTAGRVPRVPPVHPWRRPWTHQTSDEPYQIHLTAQEIHGSQWVLLSGFSWVSIVMQWDKNIPGLVNIQKAIENDNRNNWFSH